MSSIIRGPVDTLNISGGQFNITAAESNIWRFLIDNIAAKATHNSNNTGFELPKCHPETRQAIQRHLANWVEKACKYPIYWLYAPAGSGKTAIAKTLADSFSKTPNRCLASFFFRKSSAHQNTEERFIATIACQIRTNLPRAAPFINRAIEKDPAIFQKDLLVQMDELILSPLNGACEIEITADRTTWPRLLVIDGLDECSSQEAQLKILDVISHLVRHISKSLPLAVFLSCRPAAHILGAFHSERLKKISLKTCLPDIYSSDCDIRTFLVRRFKEVVDTHRHILPFPHDWPGNDVIDILVSKSSGQFIYASTVVKYIDIEDDNPMERLAIVRGLEKCPDSENPFTELDALYSHILARVKDRHRPTVIRLLQVTLSQSDPGVRRNLGDDCLMISIASLLDLKPGEFEYSLKNLEGILVEGSGGRSSLKFYHASLTEFLLDDTRSGPYFIDISLAHTHFIVSVLRYILSSNDIPNDKGNVVRRAIRSVLHCLPFAAVNEDLRQMLCCVNKHTAILKIVHNLATGDGVTLLSRRNIHTWELMVEFVNRLKQWLFSDAMTLKAGFLTSIKKYDSQEFAKYAEEPLCHLAGNSSEVLQPCFRTTPAQPQVQGIVASGLVHEHMKKSPNPTQIPLRHLPQPPTPLSPFSKDIDLSSYSPTLKHEGDGWFVLFNQSPKIKQVLNVNLVHSLVHNSLVTCAKFSHDGKWLATGCKRTAQIYHVKTGVKTCILDHKDDNYLWSITFSPDGKYLVTGHDRQIKIWDIANQQIHNIFKGHYSTIWSLNFSPNGQYIVSGSVDGVYIWNIHNRTFYVLSNNGCYYLSPDCRVWSVAISPDGRYVAVGCADMAVRIWEIETGVLIQTLRGHKSCVESVTFTLDGKGLISGSWDTTLKYWDITGLGIGSGASAVPISTSSVASSLCIMNFTSHKDAVYSTAVSYDSTWVVSGSQDGNVLFWNTRTGVVQCMWSGHQQVIVEVLMSPIENFLAMVNFDGRVSIWSY